MVAGNSLKDTEFSKLDEEPIIHINRISKIPKKLTDLPIKSSESEFEIISESKEKLNVGEITHEYLKFINSHIMIRLHQIEKSLERLEEKQVRQEKTQLQNKETTDKDSESDVIVKEELESLIKKYGMKELTHTIDEISSKRILRNKK